MIWPRGDNLMIYLDAADRWWRGLPLYADSGSGQGFIGPPFQAVAFVPLTGLPSAWTSLTWDAIHLLALVWAIAAWRSALGLSRSTCIVATIAVTGPIISDIHQQNLSLLVFALLGGAAWALSRDRNLSAGAMLGLAIAIKGYPALLLFTGIAARRRTFVGTTVLVVGLLTGVGLLPYGLAAWRQWFALSGPDFWPTWSFNQSLPALWLRLGLGWPRAFEVILLTVAACLAWRWQHRSIAVAAAGMLAVMPLVSPYAWSHYFVLLWPPVAWLWHDEKTWQSSLFFCKHPPCPRCGACAVCFNFHHVGLGCSKDNCPYRWWHQVRDYFRRKPERWIVLISTLLLSGTSRFTIGADGEYWARLIAHNATAALVVVGTLTRRVKQ